MKNLLVTIVAAFMAVVGYAQTTFNVRVGAGVFQYSSEDKPDDYYINDAFGGALTFEANIPLGDKVNKYIFSPSISIMTDFCGEICAVAPLHFGYKVHLSTGSLFIPKIGPMIGTHYTLDYYGEDHNEVAFGPSSEFAFEIKHFVVAANGYYDVLNSCGGVFCTVGYKF